MGNEPTRWKYSSELFDELPPSARLICEAIKSDPTGNRYFILSNHFEITYFTYCSDDPYYAVIHGKIIDGRIRGVKHDIQIAISFERLDTGDYRIMYQIIGEG